MSPTEVLKHEHKIVLMVLEGAEKIAKKIKETGYADIENIEKFIDFSRHFTDGCHHTKEEKHLFPKMAENGFSPDSGPIAVMLMEHVQGRRLIAQIEENMKSVKNGDELKKGDLADSILLYVGLLDNHIQKENNILFNMADRILSPGVQAELSDAFDKVEAEEVGAGVHERYHQWAHEIAAK